MTQRRARAKTTSATTTNPAHLSFEDAFSQMQDVIAQLERGDLPLDASVTTFERGMHLAQQCNDLLAKAELHVQQIEELADGSLALTDIEIATE